MKSAIHFTQKELQTRWGVTGRTVRRQVREFKLLPSDFSGRDPLFNEADVEAMEARRHAERLKKLKGKSQGGAK